MIRIHISVVCYALLCIGKVYARVPLRTWIVDMNSYYYVSIISMKLSNGVSLGQRLVCRLSIRSAIK